MPCQSPGVEGQPACEMIGATLSTSGATDKSTATDLKVAGQGGSYTYNRTFPMNADTVAALGRSAFCRLGDMRPGAQISVTRSDGTDAVFVVDDVAEYPKDGFPTMQVYGNTDRAELRLITCGGDHNHDIGHYVDNIVAYAHLTSSRPA